MSFPLEIKDLILEIPHESSLISADVSAGNSQFLSFF